MEKEAAGYLAMLIQETYRRSNYTTAIKTLLYVCVCVCMCMRVCVCVKRRQGPGSAAKDSWITDKLPEPPRAKSKKKDQRGQSEEAPNAAKAQVNKGGHFAFLPHILCVT